MLPAAITRIMSRRLKPPFLTSSSFMRTAPNNEKVGFCLTGMRRFKHPKKLPVVAIGASRPFESTVLGGLRSTICRAPLRLSPRLPMRRGGGIAIAAANNAAFERNRKVSCVIYAADKNADSAQSTRSGPVDDVFCSELRRTGFW
jgi:hypothetical protein